MTRVLSYPFSSHVFHELYPMLLGTIMDEGELRTNARTGRRVRTVPGITFTLRDSASALLPVDGFRRLRPGTAAAEVAWFLSGSRSVRRLQELGCRIWDQFADGDGTVEAAYGYRWRVHFGRDQVLRAIDVLRSDPSSRQVVVSAWDPREDGLGARGKNFPCPAMFTFNAVGDRLHSTMLLRSSDVFVGLPYDVMGHALLLALVANSTGLMPGQTTFALADAHLYEAHWGLVRMGLNREDRHVAQVRLPAMTVEEVTDDPEAFVRLYRALSAEASWPGFDPRPEVVP